MTISDLGVFLLGIISWKASLLFNGEGFGFHLMEGFIFRWVGNGMPHWGHRMWWGGGFKKNHRMGSTGWPTPSAPIINHNLIIDLFFVNQVDIYINTLEVAVHAYYNISWFFFYCEVASIFHKKITIPIKRCWGVDEYKDICFRLIMESCKTDLTPSFKISNPWWMKLISVWVVSID